MNNLGFLDVIQILATVAAFVLGILPTYVNVKNENGLTTKGIYILFFFGGTVFLAVFATTCKAIDDGEKYQNIINGADSTLNSVNLTLSRADSSINLSLQSLNTIKDVQERAELLQLRSSELNQKLEKEILIQKEISRTGRDLILSTQKLLYPIDQDIYITLSIRFSNPTLCDSLRRYVTAGGWLGSPGYIEQQFPFFDNIQAFFSNLKLYIDFADNRSKKSVLSLTNVSELSVFYVSNDKYGLESLNRRIPDNQFVIKYDLASDEYLFVCHSIPLKITSNSFYSIRDYQHAKVTVNLGMKISDPSLANDYFLDWSNSSIDFGINFGYKITSQSLHIDRHKSQDIYYWPPDYIIDRIDLNISQ